MPFDDVSSLEAALTPQTIAILLEPVQGEGGVVVPGAAYLRQVRALCDERGLLLILDEVQTGIGRTGTLFAYEQSAITPDIMSLAKGLGSGVPIGAMLAAAPVADSFDKGAHGSTFGGNALTCAVAVAVLDTLEKENLLTHCQQMGERLSTGLQQLAVKHSSIRQVRGRGLLLAAELDRPGAEVVDRCRAAGLIINCTMERVLRFTPPLIVDAAEVDEALAIVDQALAA